MRTHPMFGLLIVACALTLPAIGSILLTSPVRGQPEDAPPVAPAGVPPLAAVGDSDFIGVSFCAGCHRGGEPPMDWVKQGSLDFIQLDEYKIWSEKDMHYVAYQSLSNELGQQMGKILGWDVTEDARCLTCHAVDMFPTKTLADKQVDDFATEGGVSCEACHGPAKDWLLAHANPRNWRSKELTAAQKSELGLIDLRDPQVRAQKCASCHVGSMTEGKMVTHEMYAAGHPPLPGFEILTFSEDEPRHWMLKRDTKVITDLAAMSPEKARDIYHYRANENEQARLMAVGAVVCFRQAMETLAVEAGQQLGEGGRVEGLIDFAYFDCYACHHDLKYPSWRQERGYQGVPGRPTLRAWPIEMARVVLRHAHQVQGDDGQIAPLAAELEAKLKKLLTAIDTRPFGDPKAVQTAASELTEWSDSVVKELGTIVYGPEQTDQLVQAIIEAGKASRDKGALDYEAGQQLACAFNRLTEGKPSRTPQVDEAIDKLAQCVRIEFRSKGEERQDIYKRLPERLRQLYQFDPNKLRDAFLAIDEVYQPKAP